MPASSSPPAAPRSGCATPRRSSATCTSTPPRPLTEADRPPVEAEVNARIRRNAAVGTRTMTPDEAVAAGALALFGEKYGDEVRVGPLGAADDGQPFSSALCAGPR